MHAEDVDDPDEVDDVLMNDDSGILPYYHTIVDIVHFCLLFVCLFHQFISQVTLPSLIGSLVKISFWKRWILSRVGPNK